MTEERFDLIVNEFIEKIKEANKNKSNLKKVLVMDDSYLLQDIADLYPINRRIKTFLPTKEFLKFAKEFTDKFKNLSSGDYFSSKKNFRISYYHQPLDFPELSNGQIRVGQSSGIIQFVKPLVHQKHITSDYLFFLLLWCKASADSGHIGTLHADKLALMYYLLTGRPKEPVIDGLIHTSIIRGEYNLAKKRIDQLFNIFDIK